MTQSPMLESSKLLERKFYNSIVNKDVDTFKNSLKEGMTASHTFCVDMAGMPSITVLELAFRHNFVYAVKTLSRNFSACWKERVSTLIELENPPMLRIFLEHSTERSRQSAIYFLELLKHDKFSLAEEFMNMPGFSCDNQSATVPYRYQSLFKRYRHGPLHVAAAFTSVRLLELLLQKGAKVDIEDSEMLTPLFFACERGSLDSCKCLLHHGADPTFKTSYKTGKQQLRSVLFILCKMSMDEKTTYRIFVLLYRVGLDVTKEKWFLEDNAGQHVRVSKKISEDLKYLLNIPASLDIICTRTIRRHLLEMSKGKSIVWMVEKLPLPTAIKDELVLNDQ